jgi:hypothetical protein
MTRSRIVLTLAFAVALTAALGGCREEEQNRVLLFDKGTYAGKPDAELSAENLQAMRERITHQGDMNFAGGPGGGAGAGAGSGSARAPDVRPPDVRRPAGTADRLRARARKQNFN